MIRGYLNCERWGDGSLTGVPAIGGTLLSLSSALGADDRCSSHRSLATKFLVNRVTLLESEESLMNCLHFFYSLLLTFTLVTSYSGRLADYPLATH